MTEASQQVAAARFRGKVALVTGAASGIGLATARMFHGEGARVVLTDLRGPAAQAAAAELSRSGDAAEGLRHDVVSEDDWRAAIRRALELFGRVDVVVNSAGVTLVKSIEETTLEEWRRVLEINLTGTFLGTKFAIEAMRTGGGAIVNLSSVEGLVGNASLAAYTASKAGVRLLSKSAALHCAASGYGIRVNSVHPGYISTPMVHDAVGRVRDPDALEERLRRLHPVGRFGTAEEVAAGILFLASDEASFITGTELVIDGGYTAQ